MQSELPKQVVIVGKASILTKLPEHTEVHTTTPIAAGLPVLEVIRRLDEEKILTREDKDALKIALYSTDVSRRDKIVKALCDVELNMNSQFSIRRLKAVIHQNGSGEAVSSKMQRMARASVPSDNISTLSILDPFNTNNKIGDSTQLPSGLRFIMNSQDSESKIKLTLRTKFSDKESNNQVDEDGSGSGAMAAKAQSRHSSHDKQAEDTAGASHPNRRAVLNRRSSSRDPRLFGDDDDEEDDLDTKTAVNQVVGEMPMYAGNANFNVCAKISLRMKDFISRYNPNKMGRRRMAVLTGSGSFNPLTRMHVRLFYLAKQYLETKQGFVVLGSLLSPAHSMTVRERYRTHPNEILPPPHRLAVAQMLVQNSKWLSVDPWEITRRRAMDYLSLLEHTTAMLKDHFPENDIKVLYLCKPNLVPKLSPDAMRSKSYGLVCVCRAPDSDILRNSLGSKWNGVIHVAEDTAILDASIDTVTSRNVRDKIKANENVSHLVGEKINGYVTINRFGAKMNGMEEWSSEEKQLPKISSRPPDLTFPVFSKAVAESPKRHVTDNSGGGGGGGGGGVSPSMLSGISGMTDVGGVVGKGSNIHSESAVNNKNINNNSSHNNSSRNNTNSSNNVNHYSSGRQSTSIASTSNHGHRGSRSNSFNTNESNNNAKADGSNHLPNLAYVPSWAVN